MDWLQKILENAVYGEDGKLNVAETMKKINEEASKHIIPKEQYNGKVKELDTANETIKQLKKDNENNPELQKAIQEHEETVKNLKKAHKEEITGMRIDSAISKLLSEKNAKYPELLSGKFNREKLTLSEDGQVVGLDEQMKTIEETYKDMFGKGVSGFTPPNPNGSGSGATTFEALVENADNMTAEEVASQFIAMQQK